MGVLDHWHPVCRSPELGEAPLGVRLWGEPIVVFRSGAVVGALDDRCAHRGMRLSRGRVCAGKVVCPYHGWAYAPDGTGEVPGTPRQTVRTRRYDAVERFGAVWVKAADAVAPFPDVGGRGHGRPVSVMRHQVFAPLDVVLDNFTEVEHTGEVHGLFGYDTERMHEVESRVEAAEDRVRVYNRGPQKPIPRALRRLLGVAPDDHFVDDWTTRFSPVHVIYAHYWVDAETGEPRPRQLHVAVVLTPVEEDLTDLFTFTYSTSPPGSLLADRLLGGLLRAFVDLEVRLDAYALESLADRRESLRGRRLSRFDKALGLHRARVDRIYRGR